MILNKFIKFISRAKTRYISCTTINLHFLEHLERFATLLTAQDTSNLTEIERNSSRCTTQSGGKGVNG